MNASDYSHGVAALTGRFWGRRGFVCAARYSCTAEGLWHRVPVGGTDSL